MTTEAAGLGLTGVLTEWFAENLTYETFMRADDADLAAALDSEVRTWLRAALTSPEVVEAATVAVIAEGDPTPAIGPDINERRAVAALAAVAETLGAK